MRRGPAPALAYATQALTAAARAMADVEHDVRAAERMLAEPPEPADHDAERAVLAALIAGGLRLDDVRDLLPRAFDEASHQRIAALQLVALEMIAEGRIRAPRTGISPRLLSRLCAAFGLGPELDGYLASLARRAPNRRSAFEALEKVTRIYHARHGREGLRASVTLLRTQLEGGAGASLRAAREGLFEAGAGAESSPRPGAARRGST